MEKIHVGDLISRDNLFSVCIGDRIAKISNIGEMTTETIDGKPVHVLPVSVKMTKTIECKAKLLGKQAEYVNENRKTMSKYWVGGKVQVTCYMAKDGKFKQNFDFFVRHFFQDYQQAMHFAIIAARYS